MYFAHGPRSETRGFRITTYHRLLEVNMKISCLSDSSAKKSPPKRRVSRRGVHGERWVDAASSAFAGYFFLKRDSWDFWCLNGGMAFSWDDVLGRSVTHVGYCSFYSDVSQFVQYEWWTLMVFVKFSLRIPRSAKKPVDGEILTHKALLWIAVHHSMQQVLQY